MSITSFILVGVIAVLFFLIAYLWREKDKAISATWVFGGIVLVIAAAASLLFIPM